MDKMFDFFFSKDFEEKLNKELDRVMSERDICLEDQISELAEHYIVIITFLAPDYHEVKIDRDDYRKIKIDKKVYDLDISISHNQAELHEHLMAIDVLFSDVLLYDNECENILRKIEDKINKKNKD